MKKNLRHWAAAAVGAAAALAFTSCTYDPYYSSAGGSYGYGEGYGYGGSNFSTSLFISTGDPRWGYDPYTYCYYDYYRRSYYDPYLYGYYPIGYRPVVVYGVPHPYGWRPGHGYCPPPRGVRNVTVVNYRDRESAYRNSNYNWARQVRRQPVPQNRVQERSPSPYSYGNSSPYSNRRTPYGNNPAPYTQPSTRTYRSPENYSRPSQNRSYQPQPQNVNPPPRGKQGARLPSNYNTPVNESPPRGTNYRQRESGTRNQPAPAPQPAYQGGGGGRQSPPAKERSGMRAHGQPTRTDAEEKLRALGQE
jgi:hypothetical protein